MFRSIGWAAVKPACVTLLVSDLRDDKGAPLDDLFFELSTKPVERPSCGGGRVPVWREYRRTRSVAIDQPADAPDESGGEPWDRNASGLGLRRMNAAMPGACPAPDGALTELVTLRSGTLDRRLRSGTLHGRA